MRSPIKDFGDDGSVDFRDDEGFVGFGRDEGFVDFGEDGFWGL